MDEKTTTSSSAQSTSSQDGSFLIIDDSVTAADIPDSAVKLFEETPSEATVETAAVTADLESDSVAFFDAPLSVETEPAINESEDATGMIESIPSVEASTEKVEKSSLSGLLVTEAESSVEPAASTVFATAETITSMEKRDPNDILSRAIAEFDVLVQEHTRLAEAEDEKIAALNAQIAEAKAAAKKLLDNRKKIDFEIAEAKQMKDLFVSKLRK